MDKFVNVIRKIAETATGDVIFFKVFFRVSQNRKIPVPESLFIKVAG